MEEHRQSNLTVKKNKAIRNTLASAGILVISVAPAYEGTTARQNVDNLVMTKIKILLYRCTLVRWNHGRTNNFVGSKTD